MSANYFFQKAHHLLQDPSIQPALAGMSCTARSDDLRAAPAKSVLEDMREGILLAVQRNRRSVERRMWRRIGMPQFAVCCMINNRRSKLLCNDRSPIPLLTDLKSAIVVYKAHIHLAIVV